MSTPAPAPAGAAAATLLPPTPPPPTHLLLMGVCGAGKSSVGQALAAAHGLPFLDADAFHPPANVAKMARGEPLTDEDRAPWLAAIGARMAAEWARGARCVFTCSALRRVYRDALRAALPGLALVLLQADAVTLAARLAARSGHFMPPALLASQLAALEPQAQGEPAFAAVDCSACGSVEAAAQAVRDASSAFFAAVAADGSRAPAAQG